MYQNIPTKVLTGEVRLSYANLTTPRAVQQGQDAKYSVTLLIPKTDTATKANIDAQMRMILSLRFVNGLTWRQVAHSIGGGNTEDSVRKACQRFLQEQDTEN